MGLDTSIIKNLCNKNSGFEQTFEADKVITPKAEEKLSEGLLQPCKSLQREIDRQQKLHDMYVAGLREYQSNIRRSKSKRSEVLLGIQEGKPAEEMLKTACECISLMTGDKTYYKQAEKDIEKVYK